MVKLRLFAPVLPKGDDLVMIEVAVATEIQKEQIWHLFQEYAQELSFYDDAHRPKSRYHYPYFDLYWTEDGRIPFVLLYDHEMVGFCLLRDTNVSFQIAEFYITPLHRRRGFGKAVVEHIKEYCCQQDKHKILTANIYVNNTPAIRFWQSTGFRDTGRRIRIKHLRMIEAEMDLVADENRVCKSSF